MYKFAIRDVLWLTGQRRPFSRRSVPRRLRSLNGKITDACVRPDSFVNSLSVTVLERFKCHSGLTLYIPPKRKSRSTQRCLYK